MKKLSMLIASVAFVLAGCGEKDQAVAPETIDQAAMETAAEIDVVVEESRPLESASMAEIADMEQQAVAQASAETGADQVVESTAGTVAAVREEVAQEVAAASATVADDGEQPAEGTDAQPDLAQGKQIYTKNCFACHGSGAAGAPKLGDTGNWAPRIAQGIDILEEHAIKGFKGAAGYMPPKGGFMALSDDDVIAAVAYMVSESR